jgi:capsular polysaccharide transport system permease protein
MKISLKKRVAGINRLFLLTVVVPTALSILYFGMLASDVYTSESRFVVRSPERQSASPLGLLLRGAGFARAQDDSYTVQDYVLSRDALKVLDERIGLRKAYGSKGIDIFSRFAGIDPDDSFEALHRYYEKKVSLTNDTASSISTLTVRAFTAREAYEINKVLLEQSEGLVNRLNERGRQDMIKFAAAEVSLAEANAKAAALALSNYRNVQDVVDPERQATFQLQQVAKLQEELIATTTQLSQLRTFTPANPQIPALENRAKTLRAEIGKETAAVTGGNKSLANKAAGFQRLSLERDFADKQLGSAMTSLETARNEAQRKQVYLERVAQPSLPDVAQEPKRLRNILATLILGFLAWGVLSILLAGVREHQD